MPVANTDAYYKALIARDARYDGRVYVAVKTTGVYCRPVCPAPKPKAGHCLYFPSAAAAQSAGFRPCKRCRPETAPNSPAWAGTETTVRRALRLIAEGALNEASVERLGERLGVTARHLRRLFAEHLGASPSAVAGTQRLLLARQLVERSDLSMAEVSIAAGYRSLRRFNEHFKSTCGEKPSDVRTNRRPSSRHAPALTVRLGVREPFAWTSLLGFFATRAIDGTECVDERYERTVSIDGVDGRLVASCPDDGSLTVQLVLDRNVNVLAAVERARAMFDLDADIGTIEDHLRGDGRLAPSIATHAGLRVPGAWDPFELAVRAIVGQRITVAGARTIMTRVSRRFGRRLDGQHPTSCGLLFPSAGDLAQADLSGLGLTATRRRTLQAFSRAVADGDLVLDRAGDPDETIRDLTAISGIGPWTANYIAMRALKHPDAFPSGDSGLLAAARKLGIAETHASLARAANAWRPWRSYAAMHLWRSLA